MSFDVSYVAFNGVRKQDVLAVAGLWDTGRPDEANEALFSCAELPTGWTILYVNDSTYAHSHIGLLSANHAVLSVSVQSYVPLSLAAFYVRGEIAWEICHNAARGAFDLTLTGTVPPQTDTVRNRQLMLQQSETRVPRLDHMLEVPIAVAEAICGYRYDRWQFAWGQPLFTVAQPVRN